MQFIHGFGMSEAEYVRKHAKEEPYLGQEKVARYLENGSVKLAAH